MTQKNRTPLKSLRVIAGLVVFWLSLFTMAFVASRTDGYYPLTSAGSSTGSRLVALTCFALVIIAFAYALKYRNRVEASKLLLRAILILSSSVWLSAGVCWGNMALDQSSQDVVLTVTDTFSAQRRNRTEHYIGVSVPEKYGSHRLLYLFPQFDPQRYPVGKVIHAKAHDGFFGIPWCEYDDPAFHYHTTMRDPVLNAKGGRIKSAAGRFSEDSYYLAKLRSWGIPVDVAAE